MSAPIIGIRNCGNCKYATPLQGMREKECHFNPPSGVPILAQGPNGAMVLQGVASVFPRVPPETWCSHYERGLLAAESEIKIGGAA